MVLQDAFEKAQRYLDNTIRPEHGTEIVIATYTTTDDSWAFAYNYRVFFEHDAILDSLIGNGPLMVPKSGADAYIGPMFPVISFPGDRRTEMVLQDAFEKAQRYLDNTIRPEHDSEIVISYCEEKGDHWAFDYNARAFLKRGMIPSSLVDNGPIIVPKSDADPYIKQL